MVHVIAMDRTDLPALQMPDRFRKEIVYFMTPTGEVGTPKLGKNEYWIRTEDAAKWLDDGVFTLVSPLDAESVAEIEITEDQEVWLEWMVVNKISTVRLV